MLLWLILVLQPPFSLFSHPEKALSRSQPIVEEENEKSQKGVKKFPKKKLQKLSIKIGNKHKNIIIFEEIYLCNVECTLDKKGRALGAESKP